MEPIRGTDIEIKIGETIICYDDLGNGEIPIIFIHGFPFNKSSWRPQLEFLQTVHRVIAYDIRGFGKSTAGKADASIDLFADDLIHFMDALQIKTAIVCGLSMGGYILLNAAHRYQERFEGLILCDTQCNADSSEGKEKRYDNIRKIENDGLQEYAIGSLKNLLCKHTFENNPNLVTSVHNTILSSNPKSVTTTLKALAERNDSCSILSEISQMTLIVCGQEDAITPPAKAQFLNEEIKNSSLVLIDQAGHLSNLEQPAEFNEAIEKFITTTLNRF